MPKGYIVARITVDDPDVYADYVRATAPAIAKYGAKMLARGGRHQMLEGGARPRNVIIEFDSFETAVAFYHSEEYQAAVRIRAPIATAEIVAIEGVD